MTRISDVKKELDLIAKSIHNNINNIEINKIIENLVTKITGAQYSSIWVYDNKSLLIRQRDNSTPREVSVDKNKGLLYRCFATKQIIVTNYLASEKDYDARIDNPDNIKIKSKIMIPLIDNDKFLGIVTAYSSVSDIKKFDSNDVDLFKAIVPFIINSIYKMNENINIPKTENKTTTDSFNRRNSDRRNSDSIQNLQDLEKQRDRVQTSQELLDYVANIVHDIRTPSNGLFGFLEILEEQIDDVRLKKYISHAKDSASLINELTTSILDGISTKKEIAESKMEFVSTFKFFGDIAEIFSSTMYKKQISYNIYIDPSLPKEIGLESIKLKRIIINLLGNANKFTPQNQTIEFSVRYKPQDKKIHIFVQDSGIGIAKENQEQIFEAFKQAEDDTALTYGGTGLGLAISAGYVKELGGKLLIDSELDKGSTFYFDIPIEIEDETLKFNSVGKINGDITILMDKKNNFCANNIARYLVKMGISKDKIKAVTTIEAVPDTTKYLICFEEKMSIDIFSFTKQNKISMLVVEENFLSLNKENLDGACLISSYGYIGDVLYTFINKTLNQRVLIVDDDSVSLTLIKAMLEDELCEIDIATNGKDGLNMLSEALKNDEKYSIVFLDSRMPLLSGEEMLKEYRAIELENGQREIIAVSVSGDVNIENKDFDIYVGKPFNKKKIKSVCSEFLKKGQ